jgi:predicted acyl esterase
VVKLIDVYPGDFPNSDPNPKEVQMGGYQQLVRGDVFRGKFRNSFEKPEPFEPGKVTKIEFTMPDICHTFRRGTSGDGACSELLVSAGGPQSAESS